MVLWCSIIFWADPKAFCIWAIKQTSIVKKWKLILVWFEIIWTFQLVVQSLSRVIITWFVIKKSSDLIGWNITSFRLVKRHLLLESVRPYFASFFADRPLHFLPRTFIVFLPTIAEAAAAANKRPVCIPILVKRVVCTRRHAPSLQALAHVFCAPSLYLGPSELSNRGGGGFDNPLEFYISVYAFSAGYFFSPSWILDPPTALFQVLFLTICEAHWLAVSVTFSQWGDDL